MITLILLMVFLLTVAISWFAGLWTNLLNLMMVLIAGFIATNYFEPLAAYLDKPVVGGPPASNALPTYTYLLDFIAFWAIFLIAMLLLRGMTDILSRHRLRFNIWVEMIGRSFLALWVGWVMVMISAFSLQLSPLPPDTVQATPESRMMLLGPDRMWIGLMQSRSRGALSRAAFSEQPRHERDAEKNFEPFDSNADLIYKYRSRREHLDELTNLRVLRQ